MGILHVSAPKIRERATTDKKEYHRQRPKQQPSTTLRTTGRFPRNNPTLLCGSFADQSLRHHFTRYLPHFRYRASPLVGATSHLAKDHTRCETGGKFSNIVREHYPHLATITTPVSIPSDSPKVHICSFWVAESDLGLLQLP